MLIDVVRRARRRFLWNEVLNQGAWAVSVALGVLILLLILGSQILDWYWIVLLPSLALAGGIALTVRKLPPPYRIAQLLDRRLELADTLSTALFYANPSAASGAAPGMLEAQRECADRLAQGVVMREAIPFTVPRAAYAMAGLFLVASSLFALRYGFERKLDLRQPLAKIIRDSMGVQQASVDKKKERSVRKPNLPEPTPLQVQDRDEQDANGLDPASEKALDSAGVPDTDNSNNGAKQGNVKTKADSAEFDKAESEQSEGESAEEASSGKPGDNKGEQGSSEKQGGEQAGSPQQQGSAGENSSLMSKLKDAMSNLLSRMKQQSPSNGGQQQSASSQNGKQSQKQGNGTQQGKSGQQQKSGGQQGEGQDGQQGEDAQTAQNAQGSGQGQSGDQQATKQPGSGIGRQDGSKDVKLAEQLAAMGKISEIIGKRSANVTGEMTVEVQSTSQRIQTPYSQRKAEHADTGAEISRDEVPVVFQPYVQQYFEQVHKQEAGKTAPPKPPSD